MSESIPIAASASASAQQSKLSALESGNNTESSGDSSGFSTVFESATDAAEQPLDENLNELLPQEMLADGNSLPEDEKVAMWQALMLLQPAENMMSKSAANQMQSMSLLDGQRKSLFSSSMLKQDYFNMLGMQNKEQGNAIPANLTSNNISTQLAAAHFTSSSQESLLLNMNEQLIPIQGGNSLLSQSLAATGLGAATANTLTQMAPLNLGQTGWQTTLGARLQMFVSQNVQTAEIRLDPPELGTLDIKIKITNDIATVNITSANANVREAIETTIPKLREMFAESGLSLGDVNVRQESFSQQQNLSGEEAGKNAGVTESEIDDEAIAVSRTIVSDNLLDIYA